MANLSSSPSFSPPALPPPDRDSKHVNHLARRPTTLRYIAAAGATRCNAARRGAASGRKTGNARPLIGFPAGNPRYAAHHHRDCRNNPFSGRTRAARPAGHSIKPTRFRRDTQRRYRSAARNGAPFTPPLHLNFPPYSLLADNGGRESCYWEVLSAGVVDTLGSVSLNCLRTD